MKELSDKKFEKLNPEDRRFYIISLIDRRNLMFTNLQEITTLRMNIFNIKQTGFMGFLAIYSVSISIAIVNNNVTKINTIWMIFFLIYVIYDLFRNNSDKIELTKQYKLMGEIDTEITKLTLTHFKIEEKKNSKKRQ